MFACLLLASTAAAPAISRDIYADTAPLLAATGGLVRDAAPVLGYDLRSLASYEPNVPKPFRLGYAGYDIPNRGREWHELRTAHQVAADIVHEASEPSAREAHDDK